MSDAYSGLILIDDRRTLLRAKLKARDRAQLVVVSYELGMSEPRRPGT
jgi:hypothetical protein